MSRVKSIESQVTELSSDELTEFREWFAEYDAEVWDRQIEADARSGKLARLAEQALREDAAGETREL